MIVIKGVSALSQWIEVSIQTTHEAADLVAEIMRAAALHPPDNKQLS